MVVALLFELAGGGLPGGRRGEADRGIYSGGEEPTAGAHYYAGRGGEFSTEGCWDDAAAGDGAAFCVSGGAIGVVRDVRERPGMAATRVREECVAPTALEELFAFVPSPYGLG